MQPRTLSKTVFTEYHEVNWGSYITLLKACCCYQDFSPLVPCWVLAAEELECLTDSECPEANPSPQCACFPNCKTGILPGTPHSSHGSSAQVMFVTWKMWSASSKEEKDCSLTFDSRFSHRTWWLRSFPCQGTAARGAAGLLSDTAPFLQCAAIFVGFVCGFCFFFFQVLVS